MNHTSEKPQTPLVAGGQGRTDDQTEGDSWIAFYVVIGCCVLLAVGLAMRGC